MCITKPNDPKPAGACTLKYAAVVLCRCKCEGSGWMANPELRLYGEIWIYSGPFPYKGRTPVDRTVKNQESAIAHEYIAHIDPSIRAVSPLIDALESTPFPSEAECREGCRITGIAVDALFGSTMKGTQRAEGSDDWHTMHSQSFRSCSHGFCTRRLGGLRKSGSHLHRPWQTT